MNSALSLIKKIIIAGIFLIPFIPLAVSNSLFFPFITLKGFLFRFLIEFIFALWVILAITDKKYRPKKSLLMIGASVFIFVSILSTIFGVNVYKSFWSNYERMEGLVTYLHLFAYFLILTTVINTEKLWKWLLHTSLGVSVIMAIYGLLQLTGKLNIYQSDVRLEATFGNASYLAVYLLFHVFLALFYFVTPPSGVKKNSYRWFYVPVIILNSLVLYYTATRGAILGLIGGLLLASIISAFGSKQSRKLAVSSLVLILILISLFFGFRNSSFVSESKVLSRFSSISFNDSSTQTRFTIWKMGYEGFKERPILGWGFENYNLIFNKYYEPSLYGQESWFDRAHNVFLDRLTQGGVLGLLAYLSLFIFSVYYLLVKREKLGFSIGEAGILIGMFTAYFFHNLFVFDNLISLILFLTFVGYVHSRFVPQDEIESTNKLNETSFAISSALTFVGFILIVYVVNVPAFLSCRGLLNGIQLASLNKTEEALASFEDAIKYDSFGSSEAREHLSMFAGKIIQQQGVDNNLKLKVFNTAVSELKKQIELNPTDARYLTFLGVLYNKAGQYDNAIETTNKAIEFSPKKQVLYIELAGSYLNKKDYANAIEAAKIAFELDTSFDDARKVYAATLIYAGKVETAENLLKEKYGDEIIGDFRLVNAYNSIHDVGMVVKIWEKINEETPNNLQYRMSLAASYLQVGERQKAIEQLEIGIKINPEFKQQADYYINEIKSGRNP